MPGVAWYGCNILSLTNLPGVSVESFVEIVVLIDRRGRSFSSERVLLFPFVEWLGGVPVPATPASSIRRRRRTFRNSVTNLMLGEPLFEHSVPQSKDIDNYFAYLLKSFVRVHTVGGESNKRLQVRV